ncbi:MAG: AP2 domain-containing protein [Candidatus Bathyarchaeota archaeon]|nr:AP2 domain-containing protein [Candidatus Bathyarchaeum sp.]
MARIKDLTGQRFSMLVAIKPTQERTSSGAVIWECRCDCGNTHNVSIGNLSSGNVKSCGCLTKSNIAGQKFGKLTAVKPTSKKSKDKLIMWECRCDCGNMALVASSSLVFGRTRSCGCLRIESEKKNSKRMLEVIKNDILKEGTNLSKINAKTNKNNTSGIKGISWDQRGGFWRAEIMFKRKKYYLGSFKRKKDAAIARAKAEQELFNPILEKYGRELIKGE